MALKYRLPALIALMLLLISLACALFAQEIEQRYVTGWNVEPIARFSMDRQLYVNGVRCRIDEGEYKGWWLGGRETGTILGKTTWRIFIDDVQPGTYKVTYDLRTPTGAEWIPGTLRVPQIARHTGAVGKNLSVPKTWPQDKYNKIECDKGAVEFSWDRDNLYIRPAAGSPAACDLSIDALPAVPGKNVVKVHVDGITTVSWTKLFPAIPLTGQTLRYRIEGNSSEWSDVLFVGSGLPQYFGSTMVSNPPGGDDQGPPSSLLNALVDMTGFDMSSSGVSWGAVERTDPGNGPSTYIWKNMLADADLYKRGLVYCHIGLYNHWAEEVKKTDPERYWRLAEKFVAEAAKQYAAIGVKYFSLGFNEPEMFFRTDKEDYFNKDLSFMYNAVKKGNPDAVVIAGKFSSGDPRLIQSFYAHGFKDNFDVMDIHPYNNDSQTGTAMGEIVASHQTLEDLGMGQKRLFLGEGWGPTRDLKQVIRTKWDEPVSEAEADVTRQIFQNGYRCLTNVNEDYCPDWVIGAKYFTLNDNIGSTYWKQARKPVYGPDGELLYYLISELRFDKNSSFDAYFSNGGLIDFFGKPKGQWFFDFPPAMPEVRVLAAGGPEYVLEGHWYRIDVTIVNANPRPITDLKLGVRDRTGKFDGEIGARPLGDFTKAVLKPGEVWQIPVNTVVPRARPGKVRWAYELDYKYDGEFHTSDDVVATEVRTPLNVTLSPDHIILDGSKEQTVKVALQNNADEKETKYEIAVYKGTDFAVQPSMKSVQLKPGEKSSFTFKVVPVKKEPGTKDISVIAGDASRLVVTTPLDCPKMQSTLKIDGDLSDWPKSMVAQGAVRFGNTIGKGARPADDPFPEPPPAKGSALEAKSGDKKDAKNDSAPIFGANAVVAWDNDNFYLAAMVEDENFVQTYTGLDTWREDSIQIALDPLLNGAVMKMPDGKAFDGFAPDDYELGLAQTHQGPQVAIITAPKGTATGLTTDPKLAVNHSGKFTTYEVQIPWKLIQGITAKSGARFGFDILVNNFEKKDRYTLEWAGGIANGKYPERFVPVVLK